MSARFLVGAAVLLAGPGAWAADPDPTAGAGSPPAPAAGANASPAPSAALQGPVLLQLEGFDEPGSAEALRSALTAELGCVVLLDVEESRFAPRGRLVVTRHSGTRELAVTFVNAAEASATRVVEDPADAGERARIITLLAGTLARSPLEAEEPSPPLPATAVVAEPVEPEPPTQPVTASFFFPLATNFDAPRVRSNFSFSLLYGRIGTLDGLGLGMLQFASDGVQGAQVGFLGNASGGAVEGLQAALGVNSAGGLSGFQLAAVNHAAAEVSGAQLGFLNYAGSDVVGAQAGMGVNLAGDVQGGQLGLVNVAHRVRGVQLGVVNVADEVKGVPIGVISVTKDGGVHPLVWYSNVTPLNAALKFATKYTYTFLNASWDPDSSLVGPGGGLGGTIPAFTERLFVDIDVSETYLFRDSGPADDGRSLSRLRGTLRYQFLPHLSVFVGGGYVGKVERSRDASGQVGDYYYQSLGEFVAGVGL